MELGNIMTLSNSIIGVSILAMPFCFKQCGIILGVLMLIISSIVTRLTCHFLLKSAIMARRRTFELLAFHAFGTAGKFMVELGIIGFLMGTCIAFFVIIGDLGPAIIAKIMGTIPTDNLRTSILIGVALFCVLPLGLLKNVDSLHSVSTATIGFYFCLVLKTISESTALFLSGGWLAKVELWRPIGVLQCLPIFAMALSCQTQLFEIYENVPNPTLDKMNYIVKIAINICVSVYICVGFFGYSAFASQQFTGNILMSFSQSPITDVMKIGFVLSVAFSFPLVIFPCRASLYSLLFKKGYTPYEGASNYIPESRFKFLTVIIVGTSLTIGIWIPNIEVVLGLLGSTIGTMICMIFPVTCFICISTKNTNERLLAQILLFIGVIVMVMGTYANLYAMEQINDPIVVENIPNEIKNEVKNVQLENKFNVLSEVKDIELKISKETPVIIKEKPEDIRLEPPQPVEPREEIKPKEKAVIPKEEKIEQTVIKEKPIIETQTTKKVEEVDIEAIKKEDTELQEEEKNKNKEDKEVEKQKAELLKTLEEHKKEQESLIKEQKELIKELKKEQQELKQKQKVDINVEQEMRRKAANQILKIAKQAIEQLDPEAISTNQLLVDKNDKKNKEPIKNNVNSDTSDLVAKKIIEIAKNGKNKMKNIDNKQQNENLIPLPLALNKTLSDIFYKKEEKIKNVDKPLQDQSNKNEEPTTIKIIENKINNLDSSKTKDKEEKNQLPVKRDILAKEETIERERIKRDVLNDPDVKNVKCELQDEILICQKINEKAKSDILKLSHNLIQIEQLNVDTLRLTKK